MHRFLEWLTVFTYLVLFIIWIIIAFQVWSTVHRLNTPLGLGRERRKFLTAGLVVSLALAVDCGYWMIDTAGRSEIFRARPDLWLQSPAWNIIEKMPLVVAGIAFLWTFRKISELTSDESDRKHFSHFAEWALDAISILDPKGRIQYWNSRAEQMFGWRRYQVMGRDIREIMVPEDRKEEVETILNRVRSEKKAYSLERTERLTASHKTITVAIDTAPILSPDFEGYFSIIRPASQRNPFLEHPYFRDSQLPAIVPRQVFMAMPLSIHEGGFNAWDQILAPVAKELLLHTVRADRQLAAHGIVQQIFNDIASSQLFVADLTGDNPNVYYELGIAHTLGIPTLLLLLKNKDIPFNVQNRKVIYCDPGELTESLQKVKDDIRRSLSI